MTDRATVLWVLVIAPVAALRYGGLSQGGARSAVIGRSWAHIPGAIKPRRPGALAWATRRKNQEAKNGT